jgi:hypothetical protein
MLLQLTLLLTALAVNALVVLPNNISTLSATQLLNKRTRIDNTENVHMPRTDEALSVNTNKYTTQQMEQYYQGHLDTLKMCDIVIAESESDTPLFNRIFAEYFDPADRALVISETGFTPRTCWHQMTDHLQVSLKSSSTRRVPGRVVRNSKPSISSMTFHLPTTTVYTYTVTSMSWLWSPSRMNSSLRMNSSSARGSSQGELSEEVLAGNGQL